MAVDNLDCMVMISNMSPKISLEFHCCPSQARSLSMKNATTLSCMTLSYSDICRRVVCIRDIMMAIILCDTLHRRSFFTCSPILSYLDRNLRRAGGEAAKLEIHESGASEVGNFVFFWFLIVLW